MGLRLKEGQGARHVLSEVGDRESYEKGEFGQWCSGIMGLRLREGQGARNY